MGSETQGPGRYPGVPPDAVDGGSLACRRAGPAADALAVAADPEGPGHAAQVVGRFRPGDLDGMRTISSGKVTSRAAGSRRRAIPDRAGAHRAVHGRTPLPEPVDVDIDEGAERSSMPVRDCDGGSPGGVAFRQESFRPTVHRYGRRARAIRESPPPFRARSGSWDAGVCEWCVGPGLVGVEGTESGSGQENAIRSRIVFLGGGRELRSGGNGDHALDRHGSQRTHRRTGWRGRVPLRPEWEYRANGYEARRPLFGHEGNVRKLRT